MYVSELCIFVFCFSQFLHTVRARACLVYTGVVILVGWLIATPHSCGLTMDMATSSRMLGRWSRMRSHTSSGTCPSCT